MKIFAIADLHLSFGVAKPMDIFGDHWVDHALKVADSWRDNVGENDLVLLSGDFSWAMRLAETTHDFAWLRALSGKKILIRGNHDYWWSSLKKNNDFAGKDIYFIHNNALTFGAVTIAGTRLWNYPFINWQLAFRNETTPKMPTPKNHEEVDNEKICQHELERLEKSLAQLSTSAELKICLTHFPPISVTPQANIITSMIANAGVQKCLYGHLHGINTDYAPAADCEIDGVNYQLTSADWLDFKLKFIGEV